MVRRFRRRATRTVDITISSSIGLFARLRMKEPSIFR
jgi:hypothetical protein